MHEVLSVGFECTWVKSRALRLFLRVFFIDWRQAEFGPVHRLGLCLLQILFLGRLVEVFGTDLEVRHAVETLQVVVRKQNNRHASRLEHLTQHDVSLLVRHGFKFLRVELIFTLDHLMELGKWILLPFQTAAVSRMGAVIVRLLEIGLSLVVLR